MANHKSAKKRARQDVVKRAKNKGQLTAVRGVIKKFREALSEFKQGKLEEPALMEKFRAAQKKIAQAGAKGLVHKNNSFRKVSRLAHAISVAKKSGTA